MCVADAEHPSDHVRPEAGARFAKETEVPYALLAQGLGLQTDTLNGRGSRVQTE